MALLFNAFRPIVFASSSESSGAVSAVGVFVSLFGGTLELEYRSKIYSVSTSVRK